MAEIGSFCQQGNLQPKAGCNPRTDDALVVEAKSGDHPAFLELWRRHSKTAFGTAYRIMGNREDTEDVVQDTWIKVYLHLKTFDGRAQFATWLTRIAINSSLMTLRKKRARSETPLEITNDGAWLHWDIADHTESPEELYAAQERAERIRRAICRLRPKLRDVVHIYLSDDRTVMEAAEVAGISFAATKSRLSRAGRILRKTLEFQEKPRTRSSHPISLR